MSPRLNLLFEELDRYRGRIPLDELTEILRSSGVQREDVEQHIRFSEDRYRRNLVREGDAYQVLVLCWRNGQRSTIHDHTGSSCGMWILEGVATEIIYERRKHGMLSEIARNTLDSGSVCGSQDADIHEIVNYDRAGRDLVTMHIYSPPLGPIHVYTLESPDVQTVVSPIDDLRQEASV